MSHRPVRFLKRALVAFWAVWLTVVLATNVLDAVKALGLLGEYWPLASGNYRFVVETTARYRPPAWVNGVLFAGVIAWEGTAALLFWLACWAFAGQGGGCRRTLYAAFTTSLLLWGAFLIADEVCIAYAVAGTHLRLFTAQLVSLLAIELLPEDAPASRA